MAPRKIDLTLEESIIHDLSQKLIELQSPIRILDSIKWDETVKQAFFKSKFKELPKVDEAYYKSKSLHFDPENKLKEIQALELLIQSKLGRLSPLSQLMERICEEYRVVVHMLQARGTPEFGTYSQQLYGSATDAFYVGGPNLIKLAEILHNTLPDLHLKTQSAADQKVYSSDQAVEILQSRLNDYFNDPTEKIRVEISDDIVADAAAGAEVIKINRNAKFSEREIRVLEVHEGWVHLGTTLNGKRQKTCHFLSKGAPSATITQEGLALIMEMFSLSAYPGRIQKICNRISAVNMAEEGADFIQVFNFFREQNYSEDESWNYSMRVFRGALPNGKCGAFTKDVSYTKGFVQIYNYIRLAIKHGLIEKVPLLFIGKSTLQDLPLFADLLEQGILEYPKYIPPQFRDMSAISAWLSFSLFMNELALPQMEVDYKAVLRL